MESRMLEDVAGAYLVHAMDGDAVAAESVIARARLDGVSVSRVYAAILGPALTVVGQMWEHAELSIADEHMISEITSVAIRRQLPSAPRHAGPLAITACPDGEGHALGAGAIGGALAEAGWRVIPLGGSVPSVALEDMVVARRPSVVALSVKLASHLPQTLESVRRLKSLPHPPAVLVGGSAVRDAGFDLGAAHVDDRLDSAVRWASRYAKLPDEEQSSHRLRHAG